MRIFLRANRNGGQVYHTIEMDVVPRVGEYIQIVGDIGSYEVQEVFYYASEDKTKTSIIVLGTFKPNKSLV